MILDCTYMDLNPVYIVIILGDVLYIANFKIFRNRRENYVFFIRFRISMASSIDSRSYFYKYQIDLGKHLNIGQYISSFTLVH